MPPPQIKTRSAGIVPVRLGSTGPEYLLLRAYAYWDFPKGEVAPGEAPLATARRELLEETGLGCVEMRWGQDFVETPVYGRGKVARYYLAAVDHGDVVLGVSPELGRPEHHEYRWLDYDEALPLLNERVAEVLRWAHRRVCAGSAPPVC
jgi:bis(5'-nucleosidyl)-tetraphosphatase